ncbi:NAD(P)H-hydrate dehydratase [Fodinicurvata halophila]|uniref:Bifunctional NAD(P)H-hydrate repair enzyme n=1 Tax=Fodinicurvata halophila TaxID=1419723 RepID=A0ABV8ULC0_9PROT
MLPSSAMCNCLLSVAELYRADQAAVQCGVSSRELMENAGAAVSRAIFENWSPRRTLVLCGPGNNGGDGYVIARHLAAAGWPVQVAALGQAGKLPPDAAWHAGLWEGDVQPLGEADPAEADIVVDALFGAGLSRPLEGEVANLVLRVNRLDRPVVCVDVPSGIAGDSGQAVGSVAVRGSLTVTFFRKKPAHLLFPGRGHCGKVRLADIGIPEKVLERFAPRLWENGPELWLENWPWRQPEDHKYHAGHTLLLGGEAMTGAVRLAARGTLRIGSGLVSIAAPRGAGLVYRSDSPSLIVRDCDDTQELRGLLEAGRFTAAAAGPGLGMTPQSRQQIEVLLETGWPLVLDADALTSFSEEPRGLFDLCSSRVVLTPHDGEFRRLFADPGGSRVARARQAAETSGAVVLLKGPDTVVAAPDGRAVVNGNAPAELATAGSGDVLTGMIAGLLAQGMPAFQAAAAAIWVHAEAAQSVGSGLISEDIPFRIPQVLNLLRNRNRKLTNSQRFEEEC